MAIQEGVLLYETHFSSSFRFDPSGGLFSAGPCPYVGTHLPSVHPRPGVQHRPHPVPLYPGVLFRAEDCENFYGDSRPTLAGGNCLCQSYDDDTPTVLLSPNGEVLMKKYWDNGLD